MATKTKLSSPSGLDIKRNGNKFTFSWKKGSSGYTDQDLKWRVNSDDTTSIADSKVGKNTTSKSVTIDLDDYYPNRVYRTVVKKDGNINRAYTIHADCEKLKKVKFWVRGEENSNNTGHKTLQSAWAETTFEVKEPLPPKVSAALSQTYSNQTTFSWKIDYGKSEEKSSANMFSYYEYYTMLKKNKNVADGSKLKNWDDASHGTTTNLSKTITEDQPFDDNNSYTRFFKIRSVGPNGRSKFVHAKHVYATPYQAKNVTATATTKAGGAGYTIKVNWTVDSTYHHPVDSVTVQYALATPASSTTDAGSTRKVTISPPQDLSGSWTDAPGGTIKDTKKDDGIVFTIDHTIPLDQCIFVRVNTKHDERVNPGQPIFVSNGRGLLTSPSVPSAEVVDNIATINSVANNSGVSASFVGIYYRTNINTNGQLVGVWPAGNSSPISIQLPDPGTATSYSLGAQTWVADYSPITPAVTGVTTYSLTNKLMSSEIVWDDRDVPKPPKVSLTNPRSGIVRVSWDWKWTNATGVELSWANHNDAWESTDGPSTYTLTATRVSAWNVAGLEVGTWYFRVRLFQTNGEYTTYGTYSSIEEIKIAATPSTPVLTISPVNATTTGSISCYWAYTTTDGDEQAYADICEATLDSSGAPTYGQIIANANDEQFKTLDISYLMDNYGWNVGETHYLAVRVKTAAGDVGDNWSVPKPVTILTPVVASIDSTSLVDKSTSIDDQAGSTAVYLSLTNMPLSISASGADASGKITYIVERAEAYHLTRPDDDDTIGFKEETVAVVEKSANTSYEKSTDTTVEPGTTYYTRSGSEPYVYTEVTNPPSNANPSALNYYELSGYNFDVTISNEDLFIKFDDGGRYNIIVTAEDAYGQVSEPVYETFLVNWDHQAVKPIATIESDQENDIVFITPEAPEKYYNTPDTSVVAGTTYYTFSSASPVAGDNNMYYERVNGDYILAETIVQGKTYYTKTTVANPTSSAISTYYIKPFPGDVCDIYRLSVDKPELIVQDATFGTKYVDPYPALGPMGGHRVVYRTLNNDFYTDTDEPAWEDYDEDDGDIIYRFATIIDFGGEKAVLPYDLSLSTNWNKDFTETKYLGGSVQGDWNPAVSRTSTVKTRVAVAYDSDLIEILRRLAVYAGVCHVRTPDGSSYSANVNVSEDREERKINMIASFSLSITRIDSEGFDGMTYQSWVSRSE